MLSRVVVILVLALATAGCGHRPEELHPLVSPAAIVGPNCPKDIDELGLTKIGDSNGGGSIPEGFDARRVKWCAVDSITNARKGVAKISYIVKEGPLTSDLKRSLMEPDLVDSAAVCSLDLEGAVYLLLLNDQPLAVHVRIPQDECGKLRPDVLAALRSSDLRNTSTFSVEVPGKLMK